MQTTSLRSLNRRRRRRGLTLIEVLLVLSLLVVIGAIAVPLLEGSFSRAALYGSADLLRGAWAKARQAAMQSGETHVFRFEPKGSRFQIVALPALDAPENELALEDPETKEPTTEFVRLSQNRLPDGIMFVSGDIASSAQTLATLPLTTESAWSKPILFYPDGTTSDATLLLANDQQVAIRVTLRGLTGISQTADAEIEALP